jgi:hypothetical protein
MFLVTPDTVRNRGALATRQVPRRFFGRVTLWPRRGAGPAVRLRMLAEVQALRYTLPLLPLLAIGFTWTEVALPLAQAPVLMVLMIGAVEMRLLRLSPRARAALLTEAEAARVHDHLSARGRGILTRIAAGRDLAPGRLHLVVEQSALARLAPLTFVSVQHEPDEGRPCLLTLTLQEEEMIRGTLFAEGPGEATLWRANARTEGMLRMVTIDTAAVSAHARLTAFMARQKGI